MYMDGRANYQSRTGLNILDCLYTSAASNDAKYKLSIFYFLKLRRFWMLRNHFVFDGL